MMMGITMPDSGRIDLFGKPFERTSLDHVGYLPEERGLYKKMKVLDQLVFFGRLHGLAAEDARKRAVNWAARMEIAGELEKKTQELSKGMQQKIQFIATLLHDPGLVVMDEPFSGLDPVNTTLLQDALLELKSQGKAILFSTHRMDQVEKLCDSICLINNGEAVLSGRMREIKSRYERNHVIVEFEGSADFLKSEEIAEANNYSGHAEIKLKPHGDAQKLLHEAAAGSDDLPLRAGRALARRDLYSDRGGQSRCVTCCSLQSASMWSKYADAPSACPPYWCRC